MCRTDIQHVPALQKSQYKDGSLDLQKRQRGKNVFQIYPSEGVCVTEWNEEIRSVCFCAV